MRKAPTTDHYRLLQVRRDATPVVIAAAYRRLMRDAHPDIGGDAELARRLNEAYEVLSDPVARSRYDATLARAARSDSVPYRIGVRIGRYAARWARAMRDTSGRD
jgi:curved DNA-binding protein CbpA